MCDVYFVFSNEDADFNVDDWSTLYDDLNLEETVRAAALVVVEKKDVKKEKKGKKVRTCSVMCLVCCVLLKVSPPHGYSLWTHFEN